MSNRIAVIDYGMGNLRSVAKALEHVAPGARVEVTADAAAIDAADRVVFPGQGAMPDAMRELASRGLVPVLKAAIAAKPFLGICLGLQALFEHSEEGDCAGLGILPGRVRRFAPPAGAHSGGERLKVPHMGWNTVTQTPQGGRIHPLWQGIGDDSRFYFVHSYYVEPGDDALAAATSQYPARFCCAVARGGLFATQFHPEKSQAAGLALLRNFVNWDGVSV
ncbi:MAG: imidazole glycerol phosphate synthase subunit HisH [Rhodocyclaceae bacterium]|nr:imidazole glycerol phosphate synthase subunit HisH [Rhodocyclaceae bacterium]